MRKLMAFICVVFATGSVSAQPFLGFFGTANQEIDFGSNISENEVSRILTVLEEKSWTKKMEESSTIAEKVPLNSRYALYERYKIAGAWGLLNLYGVGSFFQGDPATSLVSLGGIATFEATMILSENYLRNRPEQNIWIATGATVAGVAMLYGLVRPWIFADEQNKALKEMLFGKE